MTAMALDRFLRVNGDAELTSWADVDGDDVFPDEDAPVPVWITRARGGFDWARLAELVKQGLPESYEELPGLAQLLTGLELARKLDLEEWMKNQQLDFIVFPAAGDVGRDDLFSRPESLADASRNGVVYSNGNRVICINDRWGDPASLPAPSARGGDPQMAYLINKYVNLRT